MDITAILPATNKAGISLIKILENDGKQNEFKKIVTLITSYSNVNQHLLLKQVTMQYVYDSIYNDYKNRINNKFENKYASYILCILHKKYVDFLIELRKMLELCDEEMIITNDDEYDEVNNEFGDI